LARLRRSELARRAIACLGGLLLLSTLCPSAALHASPEPSPPAANPPREDLSNLLAHLDRELAEIDTLLASAHFHSVVSVAKLTRQLLSAREGQPELSTRRARLEVMTATAQVALGRRGVAQRSMMRALQAEPALSLDESTTSPKVLELLREARRHSDIGQAEP
jgi:hypothetical protein